MRQPVSRTGFSKNNNNSVELTCEKILKTALDPDQINVTLAAIRQINTASLGKKTENTMMLVTDFWSSGVNSFKDHWKLSPSQNHQHHFWHSTLNFCSTKMYLEKFETDETKNYRRTKKKLKLLEKNDRKDQNLYYSIIGKDSKSHTWSFRLCCTERSFFKSHNLTVSFDSEFELGDFEVWF